MKLRKNKAGDRSTGKDGELASRAAFARVKAKNRERLDALAESSALKVMLSSKVQAIETSCVRIDHEGTLHELANDIVVVCAGGELPTPLLKKFGIEFETKFGAR